MSEDFLVYSFKVSGCFAPAKAESSLAHSCAAFLTWPSVLSESVRICFSIHVPYDALRRLYMLHIPIDNQRPRHTAGFCAGLQVIPCNRKYPRTSAEAF
jgi:hypothetical protein